MEQMKLLRFHACRLCGLLHEAAERRSRSDFHKRIHVKLQQSSKGILHTDTGLNLADKELCDGILFCLLTSEAVEQHGNLHRRKGKLLKPSAQRFSRRTHHAGMKRSADRKRNAPPCAVLLCKKCRLIHRSLLTTNDQLPRAVIVADGYNAFRRCCLAAFPKVCLLHAKNGGHAAGDSFRCLLHGLSAKCHGLHGFLCSPNAGSIKCRILAQRKSRRIIRPHAVFRKNIRNSEGNRRHAGLCELCLNQLVLRILEADPFSVKIQVSRIKRFPEGRFLFIKLLSHAGVLRTLPGVQICDLHLFSISSFRSTHP